jgi:hypothetical protein
MRTLARILPFSIVLLLSGCGYALQGTHSHELEKEGIRRIYVTTIRNDTYKPGVENVAYNELLQSLSAFRGIQLVSSPEDADAILTGVVSTAESQVAGTGAAPSLNPQTIGVALPVIQPSFQTIYIATLYNAVLGVSFTLTRRNPKSGQKAIIWSGSFSRTGIFPASNQLGSLGTTSQLINSSEFDRAVHDISKDMMIDVREAMLSRF